VALEVESKNRPEKKGRQQPRATCKANSNKWDPKEANEGNKKVLGKGRGELKIQTIIGAQERKEMGKKTMLS